MTIVQGCIFVVCVLAFRRGIVGELARLLKKSLLELSFRGVGADPRLWPDTRAVRYNGGLFQFSNIQRHP